MRVGRPVDAADALGLRVDAGPLQGDDGADRHLVVVGDHRIDPCAARQPIVHQVDRLIALLVGGLLLNDVHLRVLGDDVLVASCPLLCRVARPA